MIKSGRYGTIKWDPVPASPVNPASLASVNSWKLSLKTDWDDVTCWGDTNKAWVPGLPDISGSLGGFWNSDNVVLIQAATDAVAGYLELAPNSQEPTFLFGGLAYLDADVDCSLKAPKISGTFKAAGNWVTP